MKRTAFTLAEVLVVMAIMAIVSTGLWNLFAGGNRSFEESTAAGAAARSASLAIERVRKDLGRLAIERINPPLAALPSPVRVAGASEIEIDVTDEDDARSGASSIRMRTVRYKFVPRGLPAEGFYRDGQRLSGIVLERFEAKLVQDHFSGGAPFLSLAVVGADPSRRRTFVARDLVYLETLDRLRRHPHRAPNYLPRVVREDGPSPVI